MSVANLKKLIPFPDKAIEINPASWSRIEEKVNCFLPNDFKSFIDSYGTGVIGNFLWVLNPKSSNDSLNFNKSKYFSFSYNKMKELFPEDYMRPAFPKENSFLTWAFSDNGDSLFWVVNGDNPDEWKVGIHSSDKGEEEIFDMGVSAFLISLANKTLSSEIFPEDFLKGEINFVSYPK